MSQVRTIFPVWHWRSERELMFSYSLVEHSRDAYREGNLLPGNFDVRNLPVHCFDPEVFDSFDLLDTSSQKQYCIESAFRGATSDRFDINSITVKG